MEGNIAELSARYIRYAHRIVGEADIVGVWRTIGAEVRQVGSLAMGLMMTHRDIDFHVYTDRLSEEESFAAMAVLSKHPSVVRIECVNLSKTEEECIEWHAWWEDAESGLWQIDMIHLRHGSQWDGFFERMAERIVATLTPETRTSILYLKYRTPPEEKIPGVAYYQAVLRDGVRTWEEFVRWRASHPISGIVAWMP